MTVAKLPVSDMHRGEKQAAIYDKDTHGTSRRSAVCKKASRGTMEAMLYFSESEESDHRSM